jgi:replicative DNA helicase Mcm
VTTLDEGPLFQMWTEYLLKFHANIGEIADNFPQKRSLIIDVHDLYHDNEKLAEDLMHAPEMVLGVGESAVQDLLPSDQRVPINLRIWNVLPACQAQVRDFDVNSLSKIVQFNDVLVRKVANVDPKLLHAVFSCTSCHFKHEIIQDSFSYTEPLECPKDEGGCGKKAGSTTFKLVVEDSRFIDVQKLLVIDPADNSRLHPRSATVYLEDDLCKKVNPGDRIGLAAIWKARQRKEGQGRSVIFEPYLSGNYIDTSRSRIDEVITDEDLKVIAEIAKGDPEQIFVDSIAPHIEGYHDLKKALALQMFSGRARRNSDGARFRQSIHILLVGDAGIAKTKIGKDTKYFHARGFYADSTFASGVGLTVAVTDKDKDFGEGHASLEAGPMVMANLGHCIIDELDKFDKDKQTMLLGPLEEQTIEVNKAGFNSSFDCECSVLAIANPLKGRFEGFGSTVADQIKIYPPLVSRFDLVIGIQDVPNKEMDRKIGKRVGLNFFGTESERPQRRYPIEILLKYVQHMKGLDLTETKQEEIDAIIEDYVQLRSDNKDAAITPRQLEGMFRLAGSRARMHGRNYITREDGRVVQKLLQTSSAVATGADSDQWGKRDEYCTQMKREAMGMEERFIDIVKEYGGGIRKRELLDVLQQNGITNPEKRIDKAVDDGILYEPEIHLYKYLGRNG